MWLKKKSKHAALGVRKFRRVGVDARLIFQKLQFYASESLAGLGSVRRVGRGPLRGPVQWLALGQGSSQITQPSRVECGDRHHNLMDQPSWEEKKNAALLGEM